MTKEEFINRWNIAFECNKIKTLAFKRLNTFDESRHDRVERQQKEGKKRYAKTEKFKATQKRYQQSEKGKAKCKRYLQSEKGKATMKRYREKNKEYFKLYMRRRRECQKNERTAS